MSNHRSLNENPIGKPYVSAALDCKIIQADLATLLWEILHGTVLCLIAF